MVILFWITVGIGGLWVLLFTKSMFEMRDIPHVHPAEGASWGPLPKVSVIIPARDEEANISNCIQSLLVQDHRNIEIIVVDDNSSDQTAAIVSNFCKLDKRVRLVKISELPTGWTGKCNAVHQGVVQGKPTGQWLLFTDADTIHSAQSISAPLLAAIDRNVDLITIIPHLQAESFWERLMQPTVAALIALFNKPAKINNPKSPEVFGNGQFILVRSQIYIKAGGHEAIRGKVLDDTELVRTIVAAGGRMFLAMGRDLFSTRMYTNLASLIEGWAKNFYMILESKLPRVVMAVSMAVIMSFWPALVGLGSLAALLFGARPWPSGWLWAGVGIYFLVMVFQAILRGVNRWYPAYTPFAPLANLMAVYLLVRSARLHRKGRGITWKGRVVFDDQEKTDGS
jgi:chlorobactene glucosyltransferase